MSRRRFALAFATSLSVLPLLEILFFFVVSGGRQSVRGGFDPGYVAKYVGIVFYSIVPLTLMVAVLSTAVVLTLAKFTAKFHAPFILLASTFVGVIAPHVLFLAIEPDDFPLPIGLLVIGAAAGLVSAGTFCAVAGVPWRLSGTPQGRSTGSHPLTPAPQRRGGEVLK